MNNVVIFLSSSTSCNTSVIKKCKSSHVASYEHSLSVSYDYGTNDVARIVNILFKVKLQVLAVQFVTLLKTIFPYANFSENFLICSCFLKLLWVAMPKILNIKGSLSNTSKSQSLKKAT